MCGDVNGDGEVEIVDAVLVGRYVNNNEGLTWAEFCQKKGIKQDAEQALANADAFKPSDKRELTSEDQKAIIGYVNGLYPKLPINEL